MQLVAAIAQQLTIKVNVSSNFRKTMQIIETSSLI